MHVLYVLYRYPQVSQTFVRDEVAALRIAGHRVDVLGLEPGDAGIDAAWAGPYGEIGRPSARRALVDHLWHLTRRPRPYVRYLRSLVRTRERLRMALMRMPTLAREMLRSGPPEHVHTHFAWTTASSALQFAALLDTPASITVHAKDIYTERPGRLRARLRDYAGLVTVCEYNVGHLVGGRIVAAGDRRLRVVPCAVADPGAAVHEPEHDLVGVGRLVPKKGFDTLLRALAIELRAGRRHTLAIAGDGPEAGALRALASELGVDDQVTFTGSLPHADALTLIARSRLFCMPCRPGPDGDCDAMPVVLREAMVRGVPVVASRLAGIPESVDDDVGWLIPVDSPDHLAASIATALGDEATRRNKATAARERALSRWSSERQLAELLPVFEASR